MLAGEEKAPIVLEVVRSFLNSFDKDGAIQGDTGAMQAVLNTITALRCIAACGSPDILVQAENIEEVDTVWAQCGKARSTLSLVAGVIDSTPWWNTRVRPLVDNPAAYRDASPKLSDALATLAGLPVAVVADASTCEDLQQLAICFSDIKALVGTADSPYLEQVWDKVAGFWAQYKKDIDSTSGTLLELKDVRDLFCKLGLLFEGDGRLQDCLHESDSINLSRDGERRMTSVLTSFGKIAEIDIAELWKKDQKNVTSLFDELLVPLDEAKGLKRPGGEPAEKCLKQCFALLDIVRSAKQKIPTTILNVFTRLGQSGFGAGLEKLTLWVTACERAQVCDEDSMKVEALVTEMGIETDALYEDEHRLLRQCTLHSKQFAQALASIAEESTAKTAMLTAQEDVHAKNRSRTEECEQGLIAEGGICQRCASGPGPNS